MKTIAPIFRPTQRGLATLIAAMSVASSVTPVRADAPREIQADVVILGATPGGLGAAIASARLGRKVIIAEYEDHIGGIVTNGLTNADLSKKQAVGGLYYEFTRRVVKHYQAMDRGNPKTPNVKACQNGYHYEASLAERIFQEMVAAEKERIQIRFRLELKEAILEGNRLTTIVLEERDQPGHLVRITASVFVDATYEGDLAALAGAPYRTGRESCTEYGESIAGKLFLRFGESNPLPGSTGLADGATEAYCFRFHVTNVPENRVPVEKPKHFNRDDYPHLFNDIRSGKVTRFRDIVQVLPLPNGKFELNSDHPHPDTGVPSESLDLAEDNWEWPEAAMARRREIFERYLNHNIGLIWLLQNDPEVPAAVREDARKYGWPRDEFTANGHVPRQIYVRQGRRTLGEYVLTQLDGDTDPELKRTRIQATSIGIIEWPFDSHACHKYDPAHPGVREGYTMIHHDPFQVPYGTVVPRKIDGLLVPVACSASHVAYSALRMEPVFMALGEACGIAAHLAVRDKVPLRRVSVSALQRLLVARAGVITFFEDIPFDHPLFAPLQWAGARGMNLGYRADPNRLLTRRDGWTMLGRILRAEHRPWTLPRDNPEGPLLAVDVADWLVQAHYPANRNLGAFPKDGALSVGQFATIVSTTMTP